MLSPQHRALPWGGESWGWGRWKEAREEKMGLRAGFPGLLSITCFY